MIKLEWSRKAPTSKKRFTTLDEMRGEGPAKTEFHYGYIGKMNILMLAQNDKYVGIYQTLGDTTFRKRVFYIKDNLPSTALELAKEWCDNYISVEKEHRKEGTHEDV